MRIHQVILCLATTFLVCACQTSPLDDYNKLHAGMEKDQVLDIMGSPQRTERFHGKDRWTYIFYDHNVKYEKEIHFLQGNAVYVGNVWEPTVSAAEVDAKNEASNKTLNEELAQKYQNTATDYSNYENSVHGTDKVRYLPTFEPVR